MTVGSFDDYVTSLSQLSNPFDPTVPTAESEEIRMPATDASGSGLTHRRNHHPYEDWDPLPVSKGGSGLDCGLVLLRSILRRCNSGSASWSLGRFAHSFDAMTSSRAATRT